MSLHRSSWEPYPLDELQEIAAPVVDRGDVARHAERLRGAATRGRTGFEWGKYSDNAAWLRDRTLRLPIAEEDVEADDRAPGRKRDVD